MLQLSNEANRGSEIGRDTFTGGMSSTPGGSSSTPGLPPKIAKRIRGECCYSGCADTALDGSDYCAPHDAHEKGRQRAKDKRRRQRLADAGLCTVHGCGAKVGKRKRSDGTIVQRRCRACTKAMRDAARKRRSTPGGSSSTPGLPIDSHAARVAARLIPWTNSPANEGRMRLRGGKRGAPSMEERDRRDLADMQRILLRYEASLGEAYGAEVQQLSREQQAEARRCAHAGLALAVRLGMETLARYGYELPVLHPDDDPADEIDDSDDADDT